jgi:hypothetical protein
MEARTPARLQDFAISNETQDFAHWAFTFFVSVTSMWWAASAR